MSLLFRIEIDEHTVFRLIRKMVYESGELKLHIYHDAEADHWTIKDSGFKPIDNLKAPAPDLLCAALAVILKPESDPQSLENQIENQTKALTPGQTGT